MKQFIKLSLIAIFVAGIAYSGNYPPGVSYSSVLKGVQLRYEDGIFNIDNIQATFLPEGTQEGWYIIKKADGKEICKILWNPELLQSPYYLLNIRNQPDLRIKEPGDYILEIHTAAGLFYKFPFSVSKLSSPDPFSGGDFYFLEGDWSKWAYLLYSGGNPDQSLIWKVWLRNKEAVKEKDVKIRVEIVRDKDKKLICTSREGVTHTLTPQWIRYEFDTIFPVEKYGEYFKARDLLAVDGGYTLTMTIDGKPYGTWKFNVVFGKLAPTGRTDRGKADPLTFIEGGKDAFWYQKQ